MTKRPKDDPACPPGMVPIEQALLEEARRLPAGEDTRERARAKGLSEEAINRLYGERPV